MTDRESDDLYNALRDRLADFGQEPPAPLWASIRAQLPPPVAVPQLRQRARQRVLAVLALLLLVGGSTWQWWASGGRAAKQVAKRAATQATTTRHYPAANPTQGSGAIPTDASQPLAATGPGTPDKPAASNAGAAGSAAAAVVAAPAATAAAAGIRQSETYSATASSSGRIAAPAEATATAMETRSPAGATASPRQLGDAGALAARTIHPHDTGTTRAVAGAAHQTGIVRSGVGGVAHLPTTASAMSAAEATAAARTTGKHAGLASLNPAPMPVALHQLSNPQHSITNTRPATGAAAVTTSTATNAQPESQNFAAKPKTAGTAGDATTGAPTPLAALGTVGTPVQIAARLETPALLRPLPIPLAQAAGWPGTPPQIPAGPVPPPLPKARTRRWTVQLLAGPALTYRHLTTNSQLAASPSPINFYTGSNNRTPSAADLAQLERPALGGGLQASLNYVLSERWDLRAGLGYAEFATQLALQQLRRAAFGAGPDSALGINRRDTYRFLMVPVRLGYGRSLSGRWRVSLLGGLDAAFYLGGTTTEGSACACQPQTWGRTGSPYRAVSVGASLGGELRYRLNERWSLLAQPTATYLLTSLSKAPTTYPPRHLFGATALLGAAWNLP